MITGLILLAIVAGIAAFSYRQSRLEQRLIKDVALIDWINLFILPILGYLVCVFLTANILSRPGVRFVRINDFILVSVGILFLVYAYVGNSIHFVSKVLYRHMKITNPVFRINELFHGKLSHYVTTVCIFLTLFVLALLELNHPLQKGFQNVPFLIDALAGIVMGISVSRIIFYTVELRDNKSMLLFCFAMFIALISLLIGFSLPISSYPITASLVVSMGTFIILFCLRRIIIRFRWTKKRSLRLLTKIMLLG